MAMVGIEGGVRPLTEREFQQIRSLAHNHFGLDLKPGKEELVAARLGKKLRQAGFRSFREYYDHVVGDKTGEALLELIDSLTTNFTSFLREPAHFDFLCRTYLPEFQPRGRLEIWSAACSSGEEPYSIAMCLLEELGAERASAVHILATDISRRALETARQAVYPQDHFETVPAPWLPRYFRRGDGRWQGWYRVKPAVRSVVEFKRLNLTESFDHLSRFSAIFCRNVMIYFDKKTQEDLVRRLAARLEPGGYLLTGHSESLMGSRDFLEYVRPAVYRRARS